MQSMNSTRIFFTNRIVCTKIIVVVVGLTTLIIQRIGLFYKNSRVGYAGVKNDNPITTDASENIKRILY